VSFPNEFSLYGSLFWIQHSSTLQKKKLLVQGDNSEEGNHLQAVWLNCWNSVHVDIFGTEIKRPNVTGLQFNYFHLHIATNTVSPYTERGENKFIYFPFDMKSVNLLQSSAPGSATANAYVTMYMAVHSDKFGMFVKPKFWSFKFQHLKFIIKRSDAVKQTAN